MKKIKLTIIAILFLGLNLKLAAQTKQQLKDSVEKYETLSYYYADKDYSSLAIKYYDKSLDFNDKIDSIETLKKDSLYKEILLRKYKIKLP